MSVNRVSLLGNLGGDPELRYTPTQHPVCALRLATHERRKMAAGQWDEHTEWHNVIAWGTTAENCAKYLTKGRQVFIEGRIQTRSWVDAEGAKRFRTEIIAHQVHFVGGGKSEGTAIAGAAPVRELTMPLSPDVPEAELAMQDQEIPF
jgi:single-strand DNA-binding protein